MRLIIDRDVAVEMRDGTVLRADIYRPDSAEALPVLVQRTPYDKGAPRISSLLLNPLRAASAGYAVMVQDVRGRFASDGEFYTFRHEPDDGYDTIDWAAGQPWSTGKVGMFGLSYVGATQWLSAIKTPPALGAMVPVVTASDYHEGWAYQGGAFELGFNASWTLSNLALATLVKRQKAGEVFPDGLRQDYFRLVDDMCQAFDTLPLQDLPLLKDYNLAPYYYDWLQHPNDDDYWQQWKIEAQYGKVTAPALNVGGWYDIFLGGTIRNYLGMRRHGGSPEARQFQQLLIGPWKHGLPLGSVSGDLSFGIMAESFAIDMEGIHLRWYDHWLKGLDNGVRDDAPVRIFVMGENVWREEAEWPLARTQYRHYYLHSGGGANSLNGDGVLSPESPGMEQPDRFLYDPRHPVPTRGGPLCCWPGALPQGPYDQTVVEHREDVLVYTTPPLREDVEVTGPILVTLYAMSSAVDTDFTAKLVDVHASGFAQNLTDGIIRARYRESTNQPQPIEPGEVYAYTIDLWATSNVFKAGHCIRLEISSSNFPRFDRNPNTGGELGTETNLVPAIQTIYHDGTHPSHVTLPIIPGD
ncbi:MAG: CocE/NonD family hydrolase [bacterium]|nr:CocE/NonD family hydrolase [bacterium]